MWTAPARPRQTFGFPGKLATMGLLAACACAPVVADPPGWPLAIRCQPLELHPGDASVRQVGGMRYRAGFELTADREEFGGFSGLAISADGRRLAAISDRGHWLMAELRHGEDDTLLDLPGGRVGQLRDADGEPVEGRDRRDAEELVSLPGRGYLVTFEGHHRASLYSGSLEEAMSPPAGLPGAFPHPQGLLAEAENEGMEAVTLLSDGRLLIFTEGQPAAAGGTLGWVGSAAPDDRNRYRWQPLSLEPTGIFYPTGAATLPAGDVLLVERSYTEEDGTRVRLSLIGSESIAPGAHLVPREIARLESPLTVDNMESVAVRVGARGEVLVYLLSDDNFSDNQRTLLLQFELLTL